MIFDNGKITFERGEEILLSDGKKHTFVENCSIDATKVDYNKRGQIVVDVEMIFPPKRLTFNTIDEFCHYMTNNDDRICWNMDTLIIKNRIDGVKVIDTTTLFFYNDVCDCFESKVKYIISINSVLYEVEEKIEYCCETYSINSSYEYKNL